MLNTMLLLAAMLVVTAAAVQMHGKSYYDLNDADILFQHFLQQHGKEYSPEEYLTRLDIFKENLKEINELNARYPQTEYGITRFTDWTAKEKRNYLSVKHSDDSFEGLTTKLVYRRITAPYQFDWRDHGAVTHVKDQGDCGSCYIFSATGVMEGQYAIKHNKSVALSEQQSVDCMSDAIWPDPCDGGWPHEVMRFYEHHGWIKEGYGIVSEDVYPYIAKKRICVKSKITHQNVVTNVTTVHVYNMDEESMKQFLYETGPISIALVFNDFWHYKNGIAQPIKCIPLGSPNHAVLLVGYGIENGTKYWTIKNSFGTEWGEEGYIRLVRGVRACGVGRYVATCTVV